MGVELNHTIVHAKNKAESANFLSEILGLKAPESFGPFLIVRTSNFVSLDFLETDEKFEIGHYAFLVGDQEFDEIFERLKSRGLTYWADPGRGKPNQINNYYGGRGLYFADPSNHMMEIITRPYGKWLGD